MKQISIDGFEGYFVTEDGKVFSSKRGSWKELSRSVQRKYWSVKLWVNNERKHIHVHRLLAITFIPNPENKPFVNHKDGNKLNCCISNLEWVTRQENVDHAVANNLLASSAGVLNGRAVLTDNQVKEIYQSLLAGVAAIDLARLYGVEQTTIGGIKRRTKWKHITEDLPVIQFKIKTERQSETKVHQVCKMLELGILPTPIANELSVPVDLVYDLKRRKGFNHITSLYNW